MEILAQICIPFVLSIPPKNMCKKLCSSQHNVTASKWMKSLADFCPHSDVLLSLLKAAFWIKLKSTLSFEKTLDFGFKAWIKLMNIMHVQIHNYNESH